MRRFCIAAILAGTFSTLAFAQSLRPTYAPDGASQSAQSVPPKRVIHDARRVTSMIAPKTPRSRTLALPKSDSAAAAANLRRAGGYPASLKSRPE